MQKIGWIVAILCAASWFASEIRLPGEVQNVAIQGAPLAANRPMLRKDGKLDFRDGKIAPGPAPGVFGLMMVAFSLAVGIVKKETAT